MPPSASIQPSTRASAISSAGGCGAVDAAGEIGAPLHAAVPARSRAPAPNAAVLLLELPCADSGDACGPSVRRIPSASLNRFFIVILPPVPCPPERPCPAAEVTSVYPCPPAFPQSCVPMPHDMIRIRPCLRLLAASGGALILAGCGRDGPTTPEPPNIEELEYAPSLGVDISRMTRLASGLYIRDLVEGEGTRAEPQTGIRFNFQGWLHDGTPVDMGGYPQHQFSPGAFVSPFDNEVYYLLGSGQTIAAWDLGLDGMRVGGRRQLVVPPRLAFGGAGSPDGRSNRGPNHGKRSGK
ncbi:MAG: hypothetical protein F4087_03710, partial [Gemmatimonadetes bacterium]|nr:hypothetical protein [Gemmatimonadota bacterium]